MRDKKAARNDSGQSRSLSRNSCEEHAVRQVQRLGIVVKKTFDLNLIRLEVGDECSAYKVSPTRPPVLLARTF